MHVAVTGATGNIGTALIERLSADDAIDGIVAICRREHGWRPPKTSWVYADVAEDDLSKAFVGADAVVHLAWVFHPTRHPDETWRINVGGTEAVLRAVGRAHVPAVVVASSVGAYSPRTGPDPVDESWPTHGCHAAAYSREKAYVERLLDSHQSEFPQRRVVRMRPGFSFQRQSAAAQRRIFLGPLVPDRLVSRGLRSTPTVPVPRGLQLQLVHSSDVAAAYASALHRPVDGAFNIAADPPLTATSLADMLSTHTAEVSAGVVRAGLAGAFRLRAAPVPPGLFDLAMSVPTMSTTRARTELGWAPLHDAGEALHAFLDGLEGHVAGQTPPLARATSGIGRAREYASGIGGRE